MMSEKETFSKDITKTTWQNLILNINCISDRVLADYLLEQLNLFKDCLYRKAYVEGWDDGRKTI